jgi:hypothetical protein
MIDSFFSHAGARRVKPIDSSGKHEFRCPPC